MARHVTKTVVIRQVTRDGRSVREVRHPLASELLVAEMAGELPPEAALAVREHVAKCAECGSRARALAAPYDAISALGEQPVSYVPDLRPTVRQRLAATPVHVRAWQSARQLGRRSLLAGLAVLALLLVAGVGVAVALLQAPVAVGRSQNGIVSPLAAGSGAVLYAQTAKVLDVRDGAGHMWTVAEVIAADEQSGRVVRSLPSGGVGPRVARAGEQPVAVAQAADGAAVYELTSVQGGAQALVAIDMRDGTLSWIAPVTLPGGQALASDVQAVSLAVAPDGGTVYVGLDGSDLVDGSVRVVALDAASGQVVRSLAPQMPLSSPLPPDGAPLPAVTPTPEPPFAPLPGSRYVLAADGAIAISPDGLWLFDAATYTDGTGQQTAVVRRYDAQTGEVAQTLALQGDFRLAALAASPSVMSPTLYLATGGAAGQVYMLSMDATGPLLLGQVPLGGPTAPATSAFEGQISVSTTADGKQAYVSADVAVGSQPIAAHDIWLVDSGTVSVLAHQVPFLGAGQVLPNWADAANGQSFDLIGGEVYLLWLAPGGGTTPWLRIADGQPVVALIGTAAEQ